MHKALGLSFVPVGVRVLLSHPYPVTSSWFLQPTAVPGTFWITLSWTFSAASMPPCHPGCTTLFLTLESFALSFSVLLQNRRLCSPVQSLDKLWTANECFSHWPLCSSKPHPSTTIASSSMVDTFEWGNELNIIMESLVFLQDPLFFCSYENQEDRQTRRNDAE